MKYIQILIFFLLFTACKNQKENLFFQEEIDVKIQFIKEIFVGIPLEMEKYKNNLYVSDFRGDSLLWCFDVENFNKCKRMLPKGEGPNEFLSPIQYFVTDSSLIVHNRWHYSAQKFEYSSKNFSIVPNNDRIKLSTDIDMIFPLSGNKYVASGRFNDCRFVIMDELGKIISKCGNYPTYGKEEDSYPNFPKFMFHQSMFGYNRSENLLTSVTSHVLDIWSFIGDSLLLKKRVLLSPYEYEYKDGKDWASALPKDWVEIGTKRIYTTEKNIYVLYSPNTREMKYRRKDILNSEIWIFDWYGNPIRKIKVDQKLICFCVDEKEHKIFCIMNSPEPSIGVIPI